MLGYQFCKKVRVIIIDGGQREIDAIDECLKNIFINTKMIRYGWHAVNCVWKKSLRCMVGFTQTNKKSTMVSNENKNTVLFIFMDEKKMNGIKIV